MCDQDEHVCNANLQGLEQLVRFLHVSLDVKQLGFELAANCCCEQLVNATHPTHHTRHTNANIPMRRWVFCVVLAMVEVTNVLPAKQKLRNFRLRSSSSFTVRLVSKTTSEKPCFSEPPKACKQTTSVGQQQKTAPTGQREFLQGLEHCC